jgi:hypothetical protein
MPPLDWPIRRPLGSSDPFLTGGRSPRGAPWEERTNGPLAALSGLGIVG